MDSSAVTLAKAVLATLNAGTWSQSFTAARSYDPTSEVDGDAGLRVDVAHRAVKPAEADRGSIGERVEIYVVVRKKVDPSDLDELDELSYLVQEISDSFHHYRYDSLDPHGAVCLEPENDPAFLPGHLRELRQFTAILTLPFRYERPKA